MVMKRWLNLTRMITALFMGTLLILGSCSKEKSRSNANDAEQVQASLVSSESDGEAEMIFNGIFDDAMGASDDVGMAGTGVFGRPAGPDSVSGVYIQRPDACFILTVNHLNTGTIFPIQVIIDFGTAGCQGADGHVRSGKIIVEYTGRLVNPGSVATCTFDAFHLDSIQIEGTLRITNTSTANNRQFTYEVEDAKLAKTNGNFTKWNSHKIITQLEGLTTPNLPLDDVFQIEGGSQGQVQRGNLLVTWESSVTEPLVKKFTCRWIVKGKISQTRVNSGGNSPWEAILDFGTGDCDNNATVTINGVSHNITLH